MTEKELFRAMRGLDDQWILEAAPDACNISDKTAKPTKKTVTVSQWFRPVAYAACFLILSFVLVAVILPHLSLAGSRMPEASEKLKEDNPADYEPSFDEPKDNDDKRLPVSGEGVMCITVTSASSSKGSQYEFSGDDAQAIIRYLQNLHVASVSTEDPRKGGIESEGITWVIAIEYEDGVTQTVCFSDNRFISFGDGQWYKTDFEEASRFEEFLNPAP